MDISRVRKKLKEIKSRDDDKKKDREGEASDEEQKIVVADTGTERMKGAGVTTVEEAVEGVTGEGTIEIEKQEEPVKEIELIAFRISNEEYAVRLLEMQEIINYRKLTPVPRSPVYLRGVTFLRGKVLPVIDLKERLELRGGGDEEKKIIVLATSKNEPVGAIVSSFIRVLRFPEREILQPPPTLSEKEKKFIMGVVRMGDRFISVLNVDELVKVEAV
jgi:purine-binding chemotaxis protein CheW